MSDKHTTQNGPAAGQNSAPIHAPSCLGAHDYRDCTCGASKPTPQFSVKTFRAAGLEAKWSRNRNGAPIIIAREPGKKTWYMISAAVWGCCLRDGVLEGFRNATMLGDYFSVPA